MIVRIKLEREAWMEESESTSHTSARQGGWDDIWSLQVPTKLKIFLWRLAQHSMPSQDLLHHRNMAITTACILCGAHDSWRHALLSCPVSKVYMGLVVGISA